MKNHNIIFTGESIPAIFAGDKTQTRRLLNPQPPRPGEYRFSDAPEKAIHREDRGLWWLVPNYIEDYDPTPAHLYEYQCPYGKPGDLLWVREVWAPEGDAGATWYKAGIPDIFAGQYRGWLNYPYLLDREIEPLATMKWLSPWFMPRWASRLSIRLTNVRVERLQQITQKDAKAEGVGPIELHSPPGRHGQLDYVLAYQLRWDEINGKRMMKRSDGNPRCCAWQCNPWVWALEFEKVEK